MTTTETVESCPSCGDRANLRAKLLLIDEAWVYVPGKDPRIAYAASLRVDDIKNEHLHETPLEQFINGYYCENCGRGFVPEAMLNPDHRRYR